MDAPRPPSLPSRSLVRRLGEVLPTLVVLAALAAVGLWGHRTGWRAPPFAGLTGSTVVAESDDWCAEHAVPESICIACNPASMGEDPADWCREHGVPESRCTLCHPQLLVTGVAGGWCGEHGLPGSNCTLCHPEIARRGSLPPGLTEVVVAAGAHEHERREDHPQGEPAASAPIRDARTCQKHALKVQFASVASMDKSGIGLGAVVERPMSDSLVVNAEVDYDAPRRAAVSARAGGLVFRVERGLGGRVQAGDVLALVETPEVARAASEFLGAQAGAEAAAATAARLRASADGGFRSEAEALDAAARAREAQIRLSVARQALANLGLELPAGSLDEVALAAALAAHLPEDLRAPGAAPPGLLAVRAPFAGTVVERLITAGEAVATLQPLFRVADTSTMRIDMAVPQAQIHRLALGAEVIFRPDDARDEVAVGRVSWIATAVDELTRTVDAACEVDNPAGGLRAHAFGRAQIVVRTSPQAAAVPSEAIQWEGCCYVVFVRVADAVFQTRKVRLGARDSAFTEVVSGALPGEVVATTGSHVLKSEILKSQLGAGCTDA